VSTFDYAMYLDHQLDSVVLDFMTFEHYTWIFAMIVFTCIALIYGPWHSSIGHGYGCWQFFVAGIIGLVWMWLIYEASCRSILDLLHIWTREGGRGTDPLSLLETIGQTPEPFVAVESPDWWQDSFLYPHGAPKDLAPPHITEQMVKACFPCKSANSIKAALDMAQIWNCYLIALYLMVFINNSIKNGTPVWIAFLPLPPLISILYLGPKILRNYTLIESVAGLDTKILKETFQFMEERDRLINALRHGLRGALVRHLRSKGQPLTLGAEAMALQHFFHLLDQDGDGNLNPEELREGLARYFKLSYSESEWAIAMRTVDPDQSDHVDKEEFEEMLYGEGNVPGRSEHVSTSSPIPEEYMPKDLPMQSARPTNKKKKAHREGLKNRKKNKADGSLI